MRISDWSSDVCSSDLQAAVVHVVVEPVVHARADDDHAAAAGLVGGAGELTRDLDHVVARHPGDLFLPGRRARNVVVEACRDVAAAKATVDRKSTRLNSSH